MNIKPLGDRVLIQPKEPESKTQSGIVIPDTSDKGRPEMGTVVAVGPGKMSKTGTLIPMSVKVGDRVLFTKYGPDEIKVDSKEYLIAREEHVLAIID